MTVKAHRFLGQQHVRHTEKGDGGIEPANMSPRFRSRNQWDDEAGLQIRKQVGLTIHDEYAVPQPMNIEFRH